MSTSTKHLESSSVFHRETRIQHRESVFMPLHLSRELYKSNLFLQNKANSPGVQYDTTPFITRTYMIFCNFFISKNKAKQTQNKAKFKSAKMNITSLLTKGSEIFRPFTRRKNKANQTQFKPNFKPKLASVYQYWLILGSGFWCKCL